jgi:hypothetical protein
MDSSFQMLNTVNPFRNKNKLKQNRAKIILSEDINLKEIKELNTTSHNLNTTLLSDLKYVSLIINWSPYGQAVQMKYNNGSPLASCLSWSWI